MSFQTVQLTLVNTLVLIKNVLFLVDSTKVNQNGIVNTIVVITEKLKKNYI